MLRDQVFLCFSNNEWNNVPTSKEHLMKLFSNQNKVIYFDTLGMRVPTFRDFKRIKNRLLRNLSGPKDITNNLTICSPIAIPFHQSRLIRALNGVYLQRSIFKMLYSLGTPLPKPILWVAVPTAYPVVKGMMKRIPAILVYHCVDEQAKYVGVHERTITNLERQLAESADITFVSSRALLNAKKFTNCKRLYYLPNAVDVDNYGKALSVNERPEDMPTGKNVGFAGKITSAVDVDLLSFLANNMPQVNIILIGPIMPDADVSKLRDCRNVHFLGFKPYEELPNYIKYLDVCMLPFKLTDQILFSNPIILYEYFFFGKPVVSSNIPAVKEFEPLVYISGTKEDFLGGVLSSFREDDSVNRFNRMEIARANTWWERAETISKALAPLVNV